LSRIWVRLGLALRQHASGDEPNVWRFIEKPGIEAEYQDHMTVAFLRDAVRVLGGSTVG
jgi:hypothetical protein